MFKTTMTGSFYRTAGIQNLLKTAATGELDSSHELEIYEGEKLAVSD